jgi:uncharacterized membrane protein YkvA (DUF1232 family)
MKEPKGFKRFLLLARAYMKNADMRLRFLDAVKHYARNKNELISGFRGDLMTLVNLVRDWSSGTYPHVSKKTILLIIASLLYFLSPLDAIPDFLGAIGFTDDATVILFVLNTLRNEINRYREWKS